jgi:tetratricopeptide (TPR) repeat protein
MLQKVIAFFNKLNPVVRILMLGLIALIITFIVTDIAYGNVGRALASLLCCFVIGFIALYAAGKSSSSTVAYVDPELERGLACHSSGEKEQAIKYYDDAIRKNKNNAWAYLHRAASQKDLGQLDKALSDYDQALHLLQQELDTCSSSELQKRKKIENAITQLYVNRGQLKIEKGDRDGGLEDFNRAAKQDPAKVKLYNYKKP